MIFTINEAQREMLRGCKGISESMQYYIERKVIIADTDAELKEVQKAVLRKSDFFYAMHMYTESQMHMQLAMAIREKRDQMAKEKISPVRMVEISNEKINQ